MPCEYNRSQNYSLEAEMEKEIPTPGSMAVQNSCFGLSCIECILHLEVLACCRRTMKVVIVLITVIVIVIIIIKQLLYI